MALTKRDWTLLAISAADGEPLSPVQLQKALFLLGKMKPYSVSRSFYDFTPYNYGPFDAAIYHDAETLAGDGLVAIQPSRQGKWVQYAGTAKGMLIAKTLEAADPGAADYLRRAVAWVRSLSFQDLVKAIYAHYPEYKANSVFQG